MVTNFIERVRLALRKEGVNAAALARKAGLHRNTLYGADRPGWNPTAAVLIALEPHISEIEQGGGNPDEGFGSATKLPDNFGGNIGSEKLTDNLAENICEAGEADSHGPFSDSPSTCSTTRALNGPSSSPAYSTGEVRAA